VYSGWGARERRVFVPPSILFVELDRQNSLGGGVRGLREPELQAAAPRSENVCLPFVLPLLLGALLCVVLSACAGLGGSSGQAKPEYVLYPPPPDEPRIQFLRAFTTNMDVAPPASAFRRFIVGEPESRGLGKPYGVAIHDGQILVCDTKLMVVVIFDLVNHKIEILGGESNGRLGKPINVVVDEDGTRYVTDVGRGRVMIYDRDNRYLRAIGEPETWSPSGVVIAGERLYVTDVKNAQVVVFEKLTGEEVHRFGRLGAGDDELFYPTNIDRGVDGSFYVSDTGNFRVLKFDSEGDRIDQIGELGMSLGQMVRPKGVAVDRKDRLYVVDAASEIVQIFDEEGKLLLFFGGPGNNPGGLNLPAKVTIDYDNVGLFEHLAAPGFEIDYLILVTNQFGVHKVNVFGFLKPNKKSKE
jgi:sugar lactone lactonase YvrE